MLLQFNGIPSLVMKKNSDLYLLKKIAQVFQEDLGKFEFHWNKPFLFTFTY